MEKNTCCRSAELVDDYRTKLHSLADRLDFALADDTDNAYVSVTKILEELRANAEQRLGWNIIHCAADLPKDTKPYLWQPKGSTGAVRGIMRVEMRDNSSPYILKQTLKMYYAWRDLPAI